MPKHVRELLGFAAYMMVVGGALTLYVFPPSFSFGPDPEVPLESPQRLARIEAMAEAGPKEPDFSASFDPRTPNFVAQTTSEAGETLAESALPTSPDGTHEYVSAVCGACHSLNIVTQQRVSRQRWSELLVWMVEKQGMPELASEDESQVVDYLAKHFGTSSGGSEEASLP